MGGGLGFLNKKTWHPGRLSNIENVWKKEQEHIKEQNKLEDLRKQIADERQKEELEMVAAAAGHKVRSDRLDWMYQGGMLAKQEAEKRTEEAMMSGKPVQQEESSDLNRADQAVLLPTFYSEDTPASANETWARLHSDPLFAIRQQEQTARKAIVANPVKMDHIKTEVAKLKQSSAQSKADKKAEKKANKEAKKAKKRAADQMETALAAPRVGSDAFTNGTSARQQLETASAPRHNDRSHSHSHRDHDHAQPSSRQHDRDRSYHGDGLDDAHTHKHRRLHSPERQHDRRRSSHAHRDDYSDRRHASESERRQHSSHDHRDERSDRRHAGEADRHQHSSHLDRIAPSDRRHVTESDRHQHSNHARSESAAEPARQHANGHANGHASEIGSRLDGTKYGLSWGDTAPEELQGRDRRDAAEATRRRLDDAAKLRAQEDCDKAAQKYHRQEYKTGKLSQEEKAKRLAEMQGNAEVHDSARWQRLTDEKRKDAAEALEQGNATGSSADMMKQAHKALYGTAGEAASLEDRIGRRKYYNDKDTERGAFKR